MRRPRLRRPSPAMAVALLALLVALGGTATAASVVLIKNSKQVKAGAISLSDLSKSAQKALKGKTGPAGAQGPVGAAGAAGAPGAAGATGPRGFSAWDAIPSGTTVTGTARLDLEAPAASGDFQYTVPLPGKAPVALDAAHVNFAADASATTTDDDASCTGSSAAPTAPAGKVCLYYVTAAASNLRGFSTNALEDRGFRVVWSVTASGDTFAEVTWAYTAP